MGCDDCIGYRVDVDYFGWEEEITRPVEHCHIPASWARPLISILRHDGHTLNATLLSLSRLTWDAPNAGAAHREDGEDEQQNKNDGGALHLLLRGEKIYM